VLGISIIFGQRFNEEVLDERSFIV